MTEPLVIFDLDDTLYLERDYALSGYKAVGAWLRQNYGVLRFEDTCQKLLDSGRRGHIFDEALLAHSTDPSPHLVKQLVAIYRGHTPDIKLAPDAALYLARCCPGSIFGMITDGHLQAQKAKVMSLGLSRALSKIIFTAEFGEGFSKPHPRAFAAIEDWSAQFGRPLVYVADNPRKDFVTARARGWRTIRIARPERIHHLTAPDNAHEAHDVITSLDELDAGLSRQFRKERA
jgi:putative hydrolase of the HAD superfamily